MRLHPDAGEVRHGVGGVARFHERALHGVHVGHHARRGRAEQDRLSDFPGLLDGLDFRFPHVEQFQTPSGGVEHLPAAFSRAPAMVPQRGQVFFLGRHQFRRVEFEQRGVFIHHLAGEIDVERFKPAVHLGADLGGAGFVVGDVPPGADGMGHVVPDYRRGAQAHVLLHHRVDGDVDAVHEFVFIDRD